MLRVSVRQLSVSLVFFLALACVAEAQQPEARAGFVIRNGKDTLLTERFTRHGDLLQSVITWRNGDRIVYAANLRPDQTVRRIQFTTTLLRREPVSATAEFSPRGLKLQFEGVGATAYEVNTPNLSMPAFPPITALLEQLIRAAMREQRRDAVISGFSLRIFDTTSIFLSRISSDSIKVVVPRGLEARVAVSPSGDMLGGTARNVAGMLFTIERVSDAPEFSAAAPTVPPDTSYAAFTRFFDELARRDSIVGASIAFVQDGQIVARHNYGYVDRARARPVDDRTIFHYGSIGKTLTAIGIMQLRDRGRLSLDDHVTSYIPELRQTHNEFGSMDSITIRMLLTHTAGFQTSTWTYTQGRLWEPMDPTTWNQLVAMMPYQQVEFRPGSRYSYSNLAYDYLGRIIDLLSGDPYESYVQKNIFAPLGMTRSYFRFSPYHLAGDFSHNYTVVRDSGPAFIRENPTEFDPGFTVRAGGWNAPYDDVAKYLGFLTNATRGDSSASSLYSAVLKRATVTEMWQPRYSQSGGYDQPWRRTISPLEPDWVGLTFEVHRLEGMTLIGHGGAQLGFLSSMYLNPANGKAYIFAVNTRSVSVGSRQSAFNAIVNAAQRRLK
jgi:CubicO group peptidase (beta-lactamase class C family)